MIKNEQQYKLTKTQAAKFAAAVQAFTESPDANAMHPIRRRVHTDALYSQYQELEQQIAEYDALKKGQVKSLLINSFDELPLGLIKARIASGLSQKDLADLLQMKEQQIQRYEETEYAGASFTRLKEIVRALGLTVKEELFVSEDIVSRSNLFSNLSKLGFKRDFVLQKLLPRRLAAYLQEPVQAVEITAKEFVLQAAASIGRLLKIAPAALLGQEPIELNWAAVNQTRFKAPSNASLSKIGPYTIYAQVLALTLLDACQHLERRKIPDDYQGFRSQILSQYGAITFDTALEYTWWLGIPVLPLNDTSNFHGACWRVGTQNVIVLKQKTASATRWLFDLLHEVRHAAQHPELEAWDVIEGEEDFSKERNISADERDANTFAGQVLLAGRAKELARRAITEAGGRTQLLKSTVQKVADVEGIDAGVLANYLAFRLMSEQGVNWWGVATNLQQTEGSHWETAREAVFRHAQLDTLPEVEREWLLNALR
jgi:transcriptional regulator with XRE-family HTH domain